MQYEIAPLTKIQTTLHLVWLKVSWALMQIGILKPNDKKYGSGRKYQSNCFYKEQTHNFEAIRSSNNQTWVNLILGLLVGFGKMCNNVLQNNCSVASCLLWSQVTIIIHHCFVLSMFINYTSLHCLLISGLKIKFNIFELSVANSSCRNPFKIVM